ncbi:hypothetical protein [uncultured Bacteroides sp.]|uniref:hypothetical protein n=1 Tax=uncultured Bacteroides sp. TaxID=162156 RepID=UPI0025B6DE26|nr:hypothetical protein [uncultured Bacteroides sp.]
MGSVRLGIFNFHSIFIESQLITSFSYTIVLKLFCHHCIPIWSAIDTTIENFSNPYLKEIEDGFIGMDTDRYNISQQIEHTELTVATACIEFCQL